MGCFQMDATVNMASGKEGALDMTREHGAKTKGKASVPPALGRQEGKAIAVDPYRAIIFPNRLREARRKQGLLKLLDLHHKISDIPYVRLSKIERGEVVPTREEMMLMGDVLDVNPRELIIDVDAPNFKIEDWAAEVHEVKPVDREEEELAVLVAAAVRYRRAHDHNLTIARVDEEFGIPAVTLSRIEHAQKPFDRWNENTLRSLCALFAVEDANALKRKVRRLHQIGALDPYVGLISNPKRRMAKTKKKIQDLLATLPELPASEEPEKPYDWRAAGDRRAPRAEPYDWRVSGDRRAPTDEPPVSVAGEVRRLQVYGSPLPGGLIARTETDETIEAPDKAGPNSWALRVFRPTLGVGLPGRAVLIVDPDRFPSPGGLAVLKEDEGYRVIFVTLDRVGSLVGFSQNPELEINLDDVEPENLATVVAASYE